MTTRSGAYLALTFLSLLAISQPAPATEVAVCTDLGSVTIELFDEQAPLHTANFLRYVEQGFYSGTVFHRVLNGTIVQGGGYDRQLQRRKGAEPVANESRNGLSNVRGTVAAARTDDPDSATSQFFVNVADNVELDGSARDYGYTVFGRVSSGLEVIDAISRLPTGSAGPLRQDVPEPIVAIDSMAVVNESALGRLPAESREEHLREAISAAAAASDHIRTLELVGHLRATCAELDPYTLLTEAHAAAALNQFDRARYVLEDYFEIVDSSHPSYSDAQSLYRNLRPTSEPGVEPLIGHCIVPNLPEIPDGRAADLDSMLAGQTAVRSFMEDSEMYLDCLSAVIDEEDLPDARHSSAVRQHNQMVRLMEELAQDFNHEVQAFKTRED